MLSAALFQLLIFLCSIIFLRLHGHGGVHGFRRLFYQHSTLAHLLYNVFFFLHCVVVSGAFLDLAYRFVLNFNVYFLVLSFFPFLNCSSPFQSWLALVCSSFTSMAFSFSSTSLLHCGPPISSGLHIFCKGKLSSTNS
jgi:hypothetical protein